MGNMRLEWRSRHRYRVGGVYGHVGLVGTAYVVDGSRGLTYLSDDKARVAAARIRDVEARLTANGRPATFPGEEVEHRSVTLPRRLWTLLDGLPTPPSLTIAEALQAGLVLKEKEAGA